MSRRILSLVLLAAGFGLGGHGLHEYWISREAQRQAAAAWADTKIETPTELTYSAARNAANRHPEAGATIARITIPRLDLSLYVVEGDAAADLRRGPGHITGTALPGESGNCIIAGHRDTHFRALKDIRADDEIILETRDGTFRYRVSGTTIVRPVNSTSLRPSSQPILTLVTCYPFYYVGSAPKRFIVRAQLDPGRFENASTSTPSSIP